MKFLRTAVLLLCISGIHLSKGQITCDFAIPSLSGHNCAPFTYHTDAVNVPSTGITVRKWFLNLVGNPVPVITIDNGGTNSEFNYIFPTAGTYNLTLWSYNANGDSCTITKSITISAKPIVDFTFSPVEGCQGLCVSAICNSQAVSGTIDSIAIDWGCGGSVYTSHICPTTPITHCYTNCSPPRLIDIPVVVFNSAGCFEQNIYNDVISIINQPVANFIADTLGSYCTSNPLTVNFSFQGIPGPNMTYAWYINNSLVQSGTGRTLNHSFAVNPNCYDIKLIVTHVTGCSDTLEKDDYICVRSLPQISFTSNSDTGCIDAQTPFNLTLTNTTQGIPVLNWSISGPGLNSTITGATVNYTLTVTGVYHITATGSFGPGCSGTKVDSIIVLPNPVAAFTVDDTFSCRLPMHVNYSATPCAGCMYSWHIAGASPNANPPATTIPVYPVDFNNFIGIAHFSSLDVRAPSGCVKTVTNLNDVAIREINPVPGLNHGRGCSPLCVDFWDATPYANIYDVITSVCWSFNPSTITGACQDTLSRCFVTPGAYDVKLVVTSQSGCRDSVLLLDTIQVGTPPVCTYTAFPLAMCFEEEPVVVNMNCDSFDYVTCVWGDGDTTTLYTAVFEHFYQDTGTMQTLCTVYRDSCPFALDTFTVTIYPPIAKFLDSSTCITGDTVFLQNLSGGATRFKWYFCNGDSSTLANPAIILPRCDTCSISIIAYNDVNGCHHQKTNLVHTACTSSSMSPADSIACGPVYIIFTNTSPSIHPIPYAEWDFDTTAVRGFGFHFLGPPGLASRTGVFNDAGIYDVAMRNMTTSGCIDTAWSRVTVCKPFAEFASNNTCFPDPICFTNQSIDQYCSLTRVEWNFGDTAAIDTVNLNPCHQYGSPGSYLVRLTVRNDRGCVATVSHTVVVSDYVAINYSFDDTICPTGTPHCITDNSSGILLSYEWIIPNAQPNDTFYTSSPCFTIPVAGDYWVHLNISSNNLCTTRDSAMIHVHPPVPTGYISDDFLPCPFPPQIIDFISTSQYYDSAVWDYRDAIFTNLDTVHRLYSFPGIYPINLITFTNDGCVDSANIDTIVIEGPSGYLNVLDTPGMCSCKDTIHFEVGTVNSVTFTLLYGCGINGVNVNNISPLGTATNPDVRYFAMPYCLIDSCQPQLTFGDTSGCIVYLDTAFLFIDSPVVNFTFNEYGACETGQVCFQDSTEYHLPPNRSFSINRRWDFGDGTILDSVPNPCHTYAGPGVYYVKLYIWSNLGCFDSSVAKRVFIPVFPDAAFYADSFVCVNIPICFHDTSTVDPLTHIDYRVWDYGDSSTPDTTTLTDVCHTYSAGGWYRVMLCVYDSLGCPDCDSMMVHVVDYPVADAGPDQTVCAGAVVQLNGSGASICQWLPVGVVSNSSICNPTLQLYTDTTLTLIVSDIYQCKDTDIVVLNVAGVTAAFNTASPFCVNDSICVTDASTGIHDTLLTWTYDFGDGPPTISGPNACHKYAAAGNYNIILTVTDNIGCVDSTLQSIVINPIPNAAFTVNGSVLCSNKPLCVTDQSTGNGLSWNWDFGYPGGVSTVQNPACFVYPGPPFDPSYPITLRVTDVNNCWDTASATVTVNTAPTAVFNWTTSCWNTLMSLVSSSTMGSSAINSCVWTIWAGGAPVTDTNCNTAYQFSTGFHDVQLVVTDVNGCADTVLHTVQTDTSTMVSINPGDTTICIGTSLDYTVTGFFNSITWRPPTWLSCDTCAHVFITPLGNVSYVVSAVNGACTPSMDTITIHVIQEIPIDVMANPDHIVLGMSSNITSIIPGQIDSIQWSPDSTLDCYDCPNPVATPTQTTTYTATIYYSYNGVTCTHMASVTIQFLNSCDDIAPYLPNTFTPNGDGVNDIFMIRGIAGKKINYLRVFDRWGKLVFETTNGELNDPKWGWNGNDMGGKKMNPAVFVFTYEIECINRETTTGKGNISLVR